ncbi:MAG: hypothetical protein LBR53_00890 [Deltaproteobacteria bacterium]|jgi:hypothetical protein|nr:hypothetical protein [Deltaproteobacteria bacterium]
MEAVDNLEIKLSVSFFVETAVRRGYIEVDRRLSDLSSLAHPSRRVDFRYTAQGVPLFSAALRRDLEGGETFYRGLPP